MKLILLLFLFLVLNIQVFSQTQIWMVPIVANDINLRLPEATVFDSITIDCPSTGKVLVRFDGNCISTPGDRIVLAASDYPDWRTNDGNTDAMVYDDIHTLSCFDHVRVYDATTGTHTYYAVAQNYAGTAGTGIASIKGNLTVEFIPDTLTEQASSGIGIDDCCWAWDNNWTHVFPSTSLTSSSTGRVLVNLEGDVYMPFGSQFHYTTNLAPTWPSSPLIFPVNLAPTEEESKLIHREIFQVNNGDHAVYGLVKIVGGDSISTNEYLLGNLCAQFIPDDNPSIQLKSQSIDEHLHATSGPVQIGQLQFTTTLNGKAWLHLTSRCQTSLEDRIRVWMKPSNDPNSVLSEITLQPVSENYTEVVLSLSGIQEVTAGTHTYDVMVDYDSTSAGTLQGDIFGLFTVQFIANPIPSKVNDLAHDDSFSVFPNPTTGKIFVSSTKVDQFDPIEITILNSSGQHISRQIVSNINDFSYDLSNLPDMEFMVQIKQGTNVSVKTIVKTK